MRNMMDLYGSIIYQYLSVALRKVPAAHAITSRERAEEAKRGRHWDITSGPINCQWSPSFIHDPLESSVLWVRIYPDFFPHKLPSIDKFSKKKNETFPSPNEATWFFRPASWLQCSHLREPLETRKMLTCHDMSTWFMVLFCSPSIESILNPLLSSFQSALSSICC